MAKRTFSYTAFDTPIGGEIETIDAGKVLVNDNNDPTNRSIILTFEDDDRDPVTPTYEGAFSAAGGKITGFAFLADNFTSRILVYEREAGFLGNPTFDPNAPLVLTPDLSTGDDTVYRVVGTPSGDTIKTGDTLDWILGRKGDDEIYGRASDDRLEGGEGKDTLKGGEGDDIVEGGEGKDEIYGGRGADRLRGDGAQDKIYGGKDKDILKGGKSGDRLEGGSDRDKLYGEGGEDKLYGGTGNDLIDGGKADDILRGEDGKDTFVFRKNDGKDEVKDFDRGEDLIQLIGADGLSDVKIRNKNGDAVLTYENTKIILDDVKAKNLDEDDFLFGG